MDLVCKPRGNLRAIFADKHTLTRDSTCYDFKDMFRIIVRSTNTKKFVKTYHFPRKLLTWYSSYFAAALDPANIDKFTATRTSEIILDGTIEVFDAFQCWLYTGRLKDVPNTTEAGTVLYLTPMLLSQIWISADMRGIPDLENAAIDMLHERICATWSVPGFDVIE
jgi:hypothetical protein